MKAKGSLIFCLLALAACGEKDLYDEKALENKLSEEYAAKFTARFGSVPEDYSWDASSNSSYWTASTRGVGDVEWVTSDWEDVQPKILNWINTNLVESKNNKALGRKFVMAVPNNEFTIMPVYQGEAQTQSFDFCIVVDDTPIKIWSKSDDFEVCDLTFTRENVTAAWGEPEIGNWKTVRSLDANNRNAANTIQATIYYNSKDKTTTKESEAVKKVVKNYKVRAKKYTFDLRQYAGHVMYFYLEITASNNPNAAKKGTKQSSTDGMMVALDGCPVPDGLEVGTQSMIVGCEAANLSTDWDMNEVVFVVYGKPYAPEVIEIENNEIDQVVSKRYMFEDLGSTDDFDFNDVVVDLRDIHTKRVTYTNGMKTGEEEVAHRQEAVIRHLGGTLPFKIMVNEQEIYAGGSASTMGTNPDKKVAIEGTPWIPSENNVSLRVGRQATTGVMTEYSVPFPSIGCQAPMVLATNTNVQWMNERASITRKWFEDIK